MEGGQKHKIGLDAPLDINSSDMLVPVGDAKFAFNRQKYLGSLLQSSVRYEDDGWFAGWWGHNFDLVISGNNYIEPTFGDKNNLVIFNRKNQNNFIYYVLRQSDKNLDVSFGTNQIPTWTAGSGTITRISDTVIQIEGTTAGSSTDKFTANVNAYTGELIPDTFDCPTNPNLIGIGVKDGDSYKFNVEYSVPVEFNYIWIRKAQALNLAGVDLVYRYDADSTKQSRFGMNTGGTFDAIFQLTDVNELSIMSKYSSTFSIKGDPVIQNVGTLQEHVKAMLTLTANAETRLEFTADDHWIKGKFGVPGFANGNAYFNDSQNEKQTDEKGNFLSLMPVNTMSLWTLKRDPLSGTIPKPVLVYGHSLPVWFRFSLGLQVCLDLTVRNTVTCYLDFYKDRISASIQNTYSDNSIIKSKWQRFNTEAKPAAWKDIDTERITLISEELEMPSLPLTWDEDHEGQEVEVHEDPPPGNKSIPTPVPSEQPIMVPNTEPQVMEDSTDFNWSIDPPKDITLTFDYGEGTKIPPIVTYTGAAALAEPARPVLSLSTEPAGVLRFNSDGGTSVAMIIAALDKEFGEPVRPTKKNVSTDLFFCGWFADGATEPVEWPYTFTVAEDITLKAKWSESEPSPLPPWDPNPAPVLPDSSFAGWFEEVDPPSRAAKPVKWSYLLTKDTTLTARWAGTLTFNSDDGTAVDPINTYLGFDFGEPTPPTKKNEEGVDLFFTGWYTDEAATEPVEWPYTLTETNVTFIAKWSETDPGYTPKTEPTPVPLAALTTWEPWPVWPAPFPKEIPDPMWFPELVSPDWVSPDPPIVWVPSPRYPSKSVHYTKPIQFQCLNFNTNYPIGEGFPYFAIGDGSSPDTLGSKSAYVSVMATFRYNYGFERKDYIPRNAGWIWPENTAYFVKSSKVQPPPPAVDKECRYVPVPIVYSYNAGYNKWVSTSGAGDLIAKSQTFIQKTYLDRVAQAVDLEDDNIVARVNTKTDFVYTTDITFNIPQVIRGYSIVKLSTLDLYTETIESFEMTLIKNSELSTYTKESTKRLRIDNNGGEGVGDYALNFVSAALTSIRNSDDGGASILTVVLSQGEGQFYSSDNSIYVYPDFVSADGEAKNMVTFYAGSDTYTLAEIRFDVENGKFLESAALTTTIAGDSFAKALQNEVNNMSCIITRTGTVNNLTIRFEPTGTTYVTFSWDSAAEKFTDTDLTHIDPYKWVSYDSKDDKNPWLTIKYTIIQDLEALFYRTFIYNKSGELSSATLSSQTDSLVQLSNGYGKIDLDTGNLTDSTKVLYVRSDVQPLYTQVFVKVNNTAEVLYLPQGIFYRGEDNVTYVSFADLSSEYQLKFIYDGVTYTAHIDKSGSTSLVYSVTDIRNGEYKTVYNRNVGDVYMYVKQFWAATVDVEKYWWINKDHVLELSKYYATLYRKVTGEVDDWMGDRWEIAQRVPRANIVSTSDLYYDVSSALDQYPVFFKLQAALTDSQLTIKYVVFDPTNIKLSELGDDSSTWKKAEVPVKLVELGKALEKNTISSYTTLNPAAMIGVAKVSATNVGGSFLLGIALNAGLQQWTLIFKNNVLSGVVNGYGYVGIDGTLTGGEIPDICCDATNGFTSVVYPLSDLPATTSTNALPNKCYGTGTQVWFVYSMIPSIVSHLTFKNGAFTKVLLDLNNNCQSAYLSTSFMTARIFDMLPQPVGISTLLANDDAGQLGQALAVVSAVSLPNLYIINLAYGYLHFINHSTGQYAYVWRNALEGNMRLEPGDPSTANNQPKTSKDIIFGKCAHPITLSDETGASSMGIWIDCVLKGVVGMINEPAPYKSNEAQNQTSPDMDGAKGSAFALDNLATTVASAILAAGVISSMSSTVVESYSLSMFYSISDKTQCFAGPGYVNHNLTAQAVAQSVLDTQIDGKKLGYFAVLRKLSEAIMAAQAKVTAMAREIMVSGAEQVAGVVIPIGSNPGVQTGIPVGQAAAAALTAAASGLNALLVVQQVAADYIIPAFANLLGSEVGTSSVQGVINKRSLQLEGTHTYGNKPMSFFWPAFGINTPVEYTDEKINITHKTTAQNISLSGKFMSQPVYHVKKYSPPSLTYNDEIMGKNEPDMSLVPGRTMTLAGPLTSAYTVCYGSSVSKKAPENMAVVEGITTFLPTTAFKNEQIGVPWPTFPPAPIHDYMINKQWKLGVMATYGATAWVSQDDTKLLDGPPSNIVIYGSTFCGVASSYTAIEVKPEYDARYLRPFAVTPDAIALNLNKYNCVHDAKPYHAFDGQGNRIINWRGGSGMDKSYRYLQYCYQINDHFKRSNIIPPSDFFGEFQGPPNIAIASYERVANLMEAAGLGVGYGNPMPGEDKDLRRYSLPVHSEPISTLPAMVRMLAPYKLAVVDGVTSLVTELRNTQTAYKAPSSTDFNINGDPFRATSEYITPVTTQNGVVVLDSTNGVAIAGLTFVGATTTEAFFYSAATRLYYSFGGGRSITKKDILNRFHDLKDGKWDFVNQEVVFRCLLGDDVLICRLDNGGILGEVSPPNNTIYNERSGFRMLSVAGGMTYQGPKRFAVNRFIINEHMFEQIKDNKRKWTRMSRDAYPVARDYGWKYENFDTIAPLGAVKGWTHNPLELVTAMLGVAEEDDGRFEWSITFAWTDQMDVLFEQDEYTVVNVQAETITQGGTLFSGVTHIFLFKECFTRQGCAGYYTFQFQSNNGIGNRERLILWGDGIVAVESIELSTKSLTTRRTQPLNTQVDVKDLQEL